MDSGRALQAVVRLLGRVRERTSEPDLYAGLVHACRYAGLLNASIAAYERAKRLDPAIRTSVAHTYFMNGQYGRAIETDIDSPPYVTVMSLMAMGRTDEAATLCHSAKSRMTGNDHLRLILDAVLGMLEGNIEDGRAALHRLIALPTFSDPEGWYYWAQAATQLKDESGALELLARAVEAGLSSVRGLETTPLLDPLLYVSAIQRGRGARAHRAVNCHAGVHGRGRTQAAGSACRLSRETLSVTNRQACAMRRARARPAM